MLIRKCAIVNCIPNIWWHQIIENPPNFTKNHCNFPFQSKAIGVQSVITPRLPISYCWSLLSSLVLQHNSTMIDHAASPSQSPLFQSSSSQLDIHLVHVLTNLVVTQVFFLFSGISLAAARSGFPGGQVVYSVSKWSALLVHVIQWCGVITHKLNVHTFWNVYAWPKQLHI